MANFFSFFFFFLFVEYIFTAITSHFYIKQSKKTGGSQPEMKCSQKPSSCPNGWAVRSQHYVLISNLYSN